MGKASRAGPKSPLTPFAARGGVPVPQSRSCCWGSRVCIIAEGWGLKGSGNLRHFRQQSGEARVWLPEHLRSAEPFLTLCSPLRPRSLRRLPRLVAHTFPVSWWQSESYGGLDGFILQVLLGDGKQGLRVDSPALFKHCQ